MNSDTTIENISQESPKEFPPLITIHATAIIDESPNAALTNDEIESVIRFLTNSDHLKRNIRNIEYDYLSSREFRNNKFKHTVGLKIEVKTENLWEGARSYLWKHVGQDVWSRGNGSAISVVKIHQK